MKRSLCVVLMLSILVSMMSGVVFASADGGQYTLSQPVEIASYEGCSYSVNSDSGVVTIESNAASNLTDYGIKYTVDETLPQGHVVLLHFGAASINEACDITAAVEDSQGNRLGIYTYPLVSQWNDVYMPVDTGTSDVSGAVIKLYTGGGQVMIDTVTLADYGEATVKELVAVKDGTEGIRSGMWMRGQGTDWELKEFQYDDTFAPEAAGKSVDIISDENYLYALDDSDKKLKIIDINTGAKVGESQRLINVRQIAWVDENTVFVTSRAAGAWIIDVTDRTNPTVLSHYDSVEMATGIDVSGNIAAITNRQFGVELVDITDLTKPTQLSSFTCGEVQSCRISGEYLFAGAWGEGKIVIYDISDPANPEEISSFRLMGKGDGLEVRGNYVYCATGQHSRKYNSTTSLESSDHGKPGYAFGNGMEIWDISDIEAPVRCAVTRTDGRLYMTGHDTWDVTLGESDGHLYAYLNDAYQGIYAYNVDDPKNPVRTAHITVRQNVDDGYVNLSNVSAVRVFPYDQTIYGQLSVDGSTIQNGSLYFVSAGSGSIGGVHKYTADFVGTQVTTDHSGSFTATVNLDYANDMQNLSDLYDTDTRKVMNYRQGGQVYASLEHNGYVYVAEGLRGLTVLKKDDFSVVQNVPTTDITYDVKIFEDTLYSVNGVEGLVVYTINDNGTLTPTGNSYQCKVSGNVWTMKQALLSPKANFAVLHVGEANIDVVDLRTFARSSVVPNNYPMQTSGLMYYRQIIPELIDNRYAAAWGHASNMYIFDFGENDDGPTLTRTVSSNTIKFNGGMKQNIFPVSDGRVAGVIAEKGYTLFDVNDLTRSTEYVSGTDPLYTVSGIEGKGIYLDEHKLGIITERMNGGCYIVDMNDLENPTLISSFSLASNPDIASASGDTLYIPAGYEGLYAIPLDKIKNPSLSEILSYDFDTDVSEFEKQMGYYATIINGTNETGIAKTDSNTYGIGAYRQLDKQAYLPLVVDNSGTTPVLSGIDRLQTPNKYIEVEYDYKPVTFVHKDNPAYQNFGVGVVTYDSNSALNHTSYFGSLYHTHGASVSSPYWGYEYSGANHDGSFDNCSHPVTLDKWYRVKLVCQLTTDTLKDGSDSKYEIPTTKCIKTYVDGELVNEKYYKTSVSNLTDEYVRALRFHASYGRAGIDNLTVRTYQSGDAPVDKGALVAAIRNFEEQNPGYTDYPGAVELINSAKATYENASASAADVTAAIADVNNAVDAMVPYTVVKAYDFEDNYDAYLAALRTTWNNSSTLANGQNTDDSVYAIGKYETRVSNFLIPLTDETETINIGTEDTPVTATVPKGIKIEGENLYVQTEFDYKVVESTPGTDKNYSAGGMLLTGFSTETNPAKLFEAQKAFGTIYHQFEPATEDTPSSAEFTAYSYVNGKASTTTGAPYIGAAEVDKWQRIKIVTQVTDSTGAMSSSNKIYFYVDGELVHTRNLHSSVATYSDGYIRFLRQHLSNGRQAIDNISVVTYRGLDNAPADKGTLVAAIRSFEADYPTYASSDSAADLINAAKTVYEDDDATKEQVDEAILKVNSAVQIFNPTDGMAIYCKDGKIVVNGSFVSDTALDEQYMTIIATYDDEGNLIRADMSEPMPVAAGNNPIHFEADIVLPEQQVTAYTWTTDTYTPLCKPVSDTITALKIFAIGNSFSIDSMEYLYNIAKSSGQFDSIVLGNAYIAGCSLDTHWENTSIDEANYTYYKNTAGIWKSEDKSLKDMLTDETWNLISMQTSPFNAGLPDTFGNLSNMTEWINTNKTNPNAELMWNMTWACAADYADNPSFRWFDYDQMKFYDSIVSTTQSVIEPNADIKYIMPVGTTIQNMRTSFIEEADNITRDGYHLGYSVGRYAAALTWFNKLTNISVDSINYNPDSTVITENVLAVIRESVNNAIRTPYAVTKSQYTE